MSKGLLGEGTLKERLHRKSGLAIHDILLECGLLCSPSAGHTVFQWRPHLAGSPIILSQTKDRNL